VWTDDEGRFTMQGCGRDFFSGPDFYIKAGPSFRDKIDFFETVIFPPISIN
jgi:hypothetical protein